MVVKQSMIVRTKNLGRLACLASVIMLLGTTVYFFDYLGNFKQIDIINLLLMGSALFLTISCLCVGIVLIAAQKKYIKYEEIFSENAKLKVSEISKRLEISERTALEEIAPLLKFKERNELKVNTTITFVKHK